MTDRARMALGDRGRHRAAPSSAPKEQKSVTDVVRRRIQAMGGRSIKIHGGPMQSGEPDIVGCLYGFMVAIETKRSESDGPTVQQQLHLEQWQRAGAVAIWGSDPDLIMGEIIRTVAEKYGVVLTKPVKP